MIHRLIRTLSSISVRTHLLMAFVAVLILRAIFWQSHGGLYLKNGSADLDAYLAMSKFLFGEAGGLSAEEFAAFRPTQLLYPIALAPIHLFGWPAPAYVFVLHGLCTVGMIYGAYLIGAELVGEKYGIIAAWVAVLNPLPQMFFTWMFTDTFYYLFLALFLYRALVAWRTLSALSTLLLVVAAIVLFLIKPEAVAPVSAAFAFLAYQYLRRYFPAFWATTIVLTAVTVVALTAALAVLRSPRLQDAFLSQLQIAHGLWMSTHTAANPHGEELYRAYRYDLPELTSGLPGDQAIRLMSRTSLELIRQDKTRYLSNVAVRGTAVLFPWAYRGWEGLWTVKEMILTLFSAIGMLAAFLVRRRQASFVGFGLCVLAMLGLVSVYVNDGNLRFRVPIQYMLLIAAPYGWLRLADWALRRRHLPWAGALLEQR